MRLPVLAIVMLFVFSILIDWAIYANIKRHTALRSRWPGVYALSSVLCWLFLVVTICLPRRDEDQGILTVMWMLWSYLTVYAAKVMVALCGVLGRLGQTGRRHQWNAALWVGLPLGVLVFALMWWGALVTRRQVEVTHVEVSSAKLPAAFDGYRIVQLSDMHVGTWGRDTTYVSKLVDVSNAQGADLIVFTGDIVNRETSELKPFLSVLSRLHAPDGVISVLGNHDYGDYVDWETDEAHRANNRLLAEWERGMGWKLLNNDHVYIKKENDSITVIGVENWGEPPFKQYGDLSKAYPAPGDTVSSLNDGSYKILLTHNPEHWNQQVSHDTDIALSLSGHTHAMQMEVRLGSWKWSPSALRYEQWGGLYERLNDNGDPVSLYVNIGSGEVALPYRIGAVPEVTVLTLRRK